MLEQGLRQLLSEDTTVNALVKGRVRPLVIATTDVRPFLVYTIVAGDSTATHSGPSAYRKANVTIGIYADTYPDCQALSEAVRNLLDGRAETLSTVRIAPSLLDDESDIDPAYEPGREQPVFVRTQTYRILYRNL